MINDTVDSEGSITQGSPCCYSTSSRNNRMGAFPFLLATSAAIPNNTPTTSPSTASSSISSKIPEERTPIKQETQRQKEVCDGYIASGLTWNVTIKFLMENLLKMGCQPPPRFIRCIDCGSTKAGGGFGILEETIARVNQQNAFNHRSDPSAVTQPCDSKNRLSVETETLPSKKLVPEIFLCQQHLVNEQHAHESLVHELIHAIDLCRYEFDIVLLRLFYTCTHWDSIHASFLFFLFDPTRTNMDPINNCIHMACTEIRAENLSGECNWSRELM